MMLPRALKFLEVSAELSSPARRSVSRRDFLMLSELTIE